MKKEYKKMKRVIINAMKVNLMQLICFEHNGKHLDAYSDFLNRYCNLSN